MRLTITLPDSARVDIDDQADEPAPAWSDPSWADAPTTLNRTVGGALGLFGELAAPVDLDKRTSLDCLVDDGFIAYRARMVDPNGVESMPGGGYLVACAYRGRRADLDDEVTSWWVQTAQGDAGTWYDNPAEVHSRIRGVWVGPVRVFSTYEGAGMLG